MNRGTDKEQYIRSIAPTDTPPTSVKLVEITTLILQMNQTERPNFTNGYKTTNHD